MLFEVEGQVTCLAQIPYRISEMKYRLYIASIAKIKTKLNTKYTLNHGCWRSFFLNFFSFCLSCMQVVALPEK